MRHQAVAPGRFRQAGLACAAAAIFVAAHAEAATLPQPSARVVQAQWNPEDDSFDRCMSTGDAAEQVMTAIMACQQSELARVDTALNHIYQRIRSRLSGRAKQRLIHAQRAWLRGYDCPLDINPAQDERVAYYYCEIGAKIERVDWLVRHYPQAR